MKYPDFSGFVWGLTFAAAMRPDGENAVDAWREANDAAARWERRQALKNRKPAPGLPSVKGKKR